MRWVRHLTDLDELREGIGLRAFAQLDPLVSYKKEAHEMYQEFVAAMSRDVVGSIYHAQLVVRPTLPMQRMQTNRGDGAAPQPARTAKTLGRNDPCWCGSGKKYKFCHMRADQGKAPEGGAVPAKAPAGAQSSASPKPAKGKQGRHR
jgi:preprotein translocase subunit SecA